MEDPNRPTGRLDLRVRDRILAGDREAAGELYREFRPSVLALARALIRGSPGEDAEDLCEDVMLAALTGIQRYDGRVPLKIWLAGIARNRWSAGRRRPRAGRLDAATPEPATDVDPSLGLERAELVTRIQDVLDTLPGRHGQLLRMHYIEGLGPPEIALRLELTEAYVALALHRARAAFRRRFSGGGGGAGPTGDQGP